MNADEAKREATKVLSFRLKEAGSIDHFKQAENFMHDMALAGWVWMPPNNRHRPAKSGEDCRTHPGEHADICRACAADRLAGDRTMAPALAAIDAVTPMARIRQVHAEATRDLCSHGVDPRACIDHRTARTEGEAHV